MGQFKKKLITKDNISELDKGIRVSELIKIGNENELYDQIADLLNINNIKDDFINIVGADTLVNTIKRTNSKYKKIDIISSFNDITLYDNKEFTINFSDVNEDYFEDKAAYVKTYPIYSASRDFFSSLYQMDKYANRLISKGHKHILKANMDLLREIPHNKKKYRLLHEIKENKFYLRAIISTGNYYNYDNNLAVIIGLITLHNEMKNSNITYSLKLCEYNESFIRIFFESSQVHELESIGYVKNIVEVSNDEIKRESLKFLGVCSIIFKDRDKKYREIFIKPQEVKSKILSIKHNQTPKTALEELENISDTAKIHSDIFKDISKIKSIKNPEEIKYLIKTKVEKAKREEVAKYRTEILSLLKKNVENIIQLLEVFEKIDVIAVGDIEVREYIRYILYQALIERK